MKKFYFALVGMMSLGLMLIGCHSKKEMSKSSSGVVTTLNTGLPTTQVPTNVSSNTPDTTIGAVFVAPVTMEVSETIASQMQQQQEELVNGWEIIEIEANQTDTLVSVELVPDTNNLQAIKLGLDETILFNVGSAVLSSKADKVLSKLAENLNDFPETNATIIGYTSTTGSAQLNMDLSMQRAQSVMDYLVTKGVSPTRMKAIGKGWSDPVASNATLAGRAKNRRVEIWITANEQMIEDAQ